MDGGGGDAGKTCPSSSAANATVVLGVVQTSGRVGYVTPAMPVSAPLLQALDDGSGPLEARYRFAGPCVEHRCAFWSGSTCSLGEGLAATYPAATGDVLAELSLPKCSIRARCRWYAENGAAACAACRYVITDTRSSGGVAAEGLRAPND